MSGGTNRLDIPVTIADDSISESAEQFLGRLSTASANAVIDVPITRVTINDNDRKINWLKYGKPMVFSKNHAHNNNCNILHAVH